MWYVIQTVTGREKTVKTLIENMVPAGLYEDIKIVYTERKKRYYGNWHLEKRPMFPGYLFIISDDVEELFLYLKKIPEMTKILGTGKELVPISESEEALIKRLSGDTGEVTMSYGIQEGDRVKVLEGSLAGLEYLITKVDRHKRKAYMEVELLGQKRTIEVGLEIVKKV